MDPKRKNMDLTDSDRLEEAVDDLFGMDEEAEEDTDVDRRTDEEETAEAEEAS